MTSILFHLNRSLASLIVRVVGAFIGDWLSPRLHIALGVVIVAQIIDAAIGAIFLPLIIRLVGGGSSRLGGGWTKLGHLDVPDDDE